ncbi:MAG: [FeFe] hydrogenase, group A [Candidatus Moraniibacteriota bacterium]
MPAIKKIKITINKKDYRVSPEEPLLQICEEHDIPVATLCNHPDFKESGAFCRLCLVKASFPEDKRERLIPACVLKASQGLDIVTEDAEIGRMRKTILELLFLEHAGLCANCFRNMECELQDLAMKYNIDEFRFVPKVAEIESKEALERIRDRLSRKIIDISNPSIARESSKCVECRRCIKTCTEIQSVKALDIQKRGFEMGVGTEHYTPLECTYCGQCALHCPTAAIIEKSDMVAVVKALKDPKKMVIAQVAPSVRFTLGEEFGMIPGTVVSGKMVAALRECGFDTVFDVITGADFTIVEEATELVERLKSDNPRDIMPMFTSCCPGWVLFCEQHYPEVVSHLSGTRSPHMMMGSLIKYYYAKKESLDLKNLVVVSIMPCTAKKYEAGRQEFNHDGIKDVDYVLTTREIAHIFKNYAIPFADLAEDGFDPSLGVTTGSGAIFSATGGVMESALRSAYYYLTGRSFPGLDFKDVRGTKGIKEAKISIGSRTLRVGVAHGLKNARMLVEMKLKRELPYDFVEIMACPGGCIGGGGQPYPINDDIRRSRIKSVYAVDKKMSVRESHKNPVVQAIYRDFLYEPGSRKAVKYLHTKHYPFEYKLRKEHMKK